MTFGPANVVRQCRLEEDTCGEDSVAAKVIVLLKMRMKIDESLMSLCLSARQNFIQRQIKELYKSVQALAKRLCINLWSDESQ